MATCSCSKLVLIVVNFVFCLCGIFLLLLGWMTKPYSENGTYMFIGAGSTTAVVSLIGLSGAAIEFSFLVFVYGLCLFLSMLAPVAAGILVWQFEFTDPITNYLQHIVQDFINDYMAEGGENSSSENSFLHVVMENMVKVVKKMEEGWLVEKRNIVMGVAGGVLLLQIILLIFTYNVRKKIRRQAEANTVSPISSIPRQAPTNPAFSPSPSAPEVSVRASSSHSHVAPPSSAPEPALRVSLTHSHVSPQPSAPTVSPPSAYKMVALPPEIQNKIAENNEEIVLHPFALEPNGNVENPVFYADPSGLDFNCKVCFEPMTPPKKIYQCKDGHALCESCSSNPSVKSCPFCRRPLDGGRNLALEELSQQYFQKLT